MVQMDDAASPPDGRIAEGGNHTHNRAATETAMAIVSLKEIRQPVGETGAALGAEDHGGMSIISHSWPAGFDVTDMLRTVAGEMLCPNPHYIVVTKGKLGIRYVEDGSEEQCAVGQVAYMRPGHTCWAIEDLEMVELCPADGNNFLFGRIAAAGLLG